MGGGIGGGAGRIRIGFILDERVDNTEESDARDCKDDAKGPYVADDKVPSI